MCVILNIIIYFFNPNISKKEEYEYRLNEEKRLISLMEFKNPVTIVESDYNPKEFFEAVKGLENEPEGGRRCFKCYRLRLEETAKLAAEKGFDYFTTTLSISPHKNAQVLNRIGQELAGETGVPFLPSDFKKRDGYKKSIELSREYCLYRQNYCGCEFSSRPEETDAATQVMTAVVSKSIAEGSGQGKAGSYET